MACPAEAEEAQDSERLEEGVHDASSQESGSDGTTEEPAEHEAEVQPEQAPPEATRASKKLGGSRSDLTHLGMELFAHEGPRRITLHAARRDDDGTAERLACGLLKSRTQAQDVAAVRFEALCMRCLRGEF